MRNGLFLIALVRFVSGCTFRRLVDRLWRAERLWCPQLPTIIGMPSTTPCFFAALAMLLAEVNPASAQTTAEMMSYCQPLVNAYTDGGTARVAVPDNQRFEYGVCWGAFRSFQTLSALMLTDKTGRNERVNQKEPVLGVCAPPGSSLTQFVRIFDTFARQHPELQHEGYEYIAITALRSAFPCR